MNITAPQRATPANLRLPMDLSTLVASAPADTGPARQTFDMIRDALKGPFWNSTLKQVAARVAAMSPPERWRLVDSLAKTPGPQAGQKGQSLLSLWIGECTTAGIGPYAGLNEKERASLWKSLVPGQDPGHLRLIWQTAMTHNRADRGVQGFRHEFTSAVAAVGTPAQRLGLESALLPASADSQVAGNVVQLIGSARNAGEAEAAFAPLSRAAMDHLVASSARTAHWIGTDQFGGTTVYSSVDTSGFEAMSIAASMLGNARQKSGFVAASQGLFSRLDETELDGDTRKQAKARVATGLSRVIVSDPCGVIENTLLQNTLRGGTNGRSALKSYVTSLLDSGLGKVIGSTIVSLQRGNKASVDPKTYLAEHFIPPGETDPVYPHAQVLGDWVGIVTSAVQSRTSSRDLAAGYASLMFTGGTDVLKEVVGNGMPLFKVPANFAAAIAKPAFNAALLSWRSGLAKSDRDFSRTMQQLALPHNAQGVESRSAWVTTFNAFFAANQQRQ